MILSHFASKQEDEVAMPDLTYIRIPASSLPGFNPKLEMTAEEIGQAAADEIMILLKPSIDALVESIKDTKGIVFKF